MYSNEKDQLKTQTCTHERPEEFISVSYQIYIFVSLRQQNLKHGASVPGKKF